ncbi:MAG TPA: amidohydrolase family protein, partial [Gammaproteobacteria bacterium]|nr:amidohydrolase family protein [Gammaproteobacteria bacterium]
MTKSILVKNALMVNDGHILEGDLLMAGGRIQRIDAEIPATGDVRILEADGRALLPGMIDDQVHFREPGAPQKADMQSESAAALAGGITSFMDMPNTNPLTVTLAELEAKYALAADRALANHSFYLGATNDNLTEIRNLKPDQ